MIDESIFKADYIKKLKKIAYYVRKDILRMICRVQSGHPGGSLSCVEILVTLYFHQMRYRTDDLKWKNRDRFILSKGHAAPALYSVLSLAGFFDRGELKNFRTPFSFLQGHPVTECPGIEMTTGPLGQGISFANGIAYICKQYKSDAKIYILAGDGELQEGQMWEAIQFASHHDLNNIILIVDNNKLQLDSTIDTIKSHLSLRKKFEAFGWYYSKCDGHNFPEIIGTLNNAYTYQKFNSNPLVIDAQTIKGKGIKIMEKNILYHGSGKIDRNDLKKYIAELNREYA